MIRTRKFDWFLGIIYFFFTLVLAVFFAWLCLDCYAATSETIVYLADRDESNDRVEGTGVRIGPSDLYRRGVRIETDKGRNLGTIPIVIAADPNAKTLEVSVDTRGKGKMLVIKNDISQKSGERLGDTFDLFCTKPKVFYLYPASDYLNEDGDLQIYIGADNGDTLDVNYIRVRSLDHKPLSAYREPMIVYDYPPTYERAHPSIWFSVYRGPYTCWNYELGCWVVYSDWWDRRDCVAYYNPYYGFFYHEIPLYQRHHVRIRYAGSHWNGDRGRHGGKGNGRQYLDTARNDNGDRGGAYGVPANKNRSVVGKTGIRRGVSLDVQKDDGTPRLTDFIPKSGAGKSVKPIRTKNSKSYLSEVAGGGTEKAPSLLTDFLPKDINVKTVGIKTKRNEIRQVKDANTAGDSGDLWTTSLQRAPGKDGITGKRKPTSTEQGSRVHRSERTAGDTNIGDYARNLQNNPTKVRPEEAQQDQSVQREASSRSIQQSERVVEQNAGQKKMLERRVEAKPWLQTQPERQAPPPPPDKKDEDKNQKKNREGKPSGR